MKMFTNLRVTQSYRGRHPKRIEFINTVTVLKISQFYICLSVEGKEFAIYIYHQVRLISLIISVSVSLSLSPSVGFLDCIQYQRRVDECKSLICLCVEVHGRTSLIHTWMLCEIRGKCPYSCCFVRCCFQDLFKTARSIFV